jgi:hypothetical protein
VGRIMEYGSTIGALFAAAGFVLAILMLRSLLLSTTPGAAGEGAGGMFFKTKERDALGG